MAEVYGEKPKMFTKEWWPYFWMYYKWGILGILFVSTIVGFTIKDCVTREKYDLEIVYMGRNTFPDEALDSVEEALREHIEDADNNKEKSILFLQMHVSDLQEYLEMSFALRTKRDFEMSDNRYAYMYIYDLKEAQSILSQRGIENMYKPLEEWYEGDISDKDLLYAQDSKPYAISLKDSKIINDAGMDGENMYLMIKNDEYSKKTSDIAEHNAKTAANILVK